LYEDYSSEKVLIRTTESSDQFILEVGPTEHDIKPSLCSILLLVHAICTAIISTVGHKKLICLTWIY